MTKRILQGPSRRRGSHGSTRVRNLVSEALGALPVVWEAKYLNGRDSREDIIQSVLGLAEHDVRVNVWPAPLRGAPSDEADGKLHSVLQGLEAKPPEEGPYFLVLHSEPNDFYRDEYASYQIGRVALGTARVPAHWVSAVELVDELWAASSFSRMALIASGVPEDKVHLMPACIDTDLFSPAAEPLPIDRGKGFAFLTLLDWDYIRGLDAVLEAYIREFRKSDDVVLVLKAPDSHRSCTVFSEGDEASAFWLELESWLLSRLREQGEGEDDAREFEAVLSAVKDGRLRQELRREREVEKAIAAEIEAVVREELADKAENLPAIRVVSRHLPRSLAPRFYSACDAFVMAPRGERWGRSFLEAMAVGLPTIGTRWGGHLDFMRSDNSFLVRTKGALTIPDDGPDTVCAGQQWADPNVEHLRELMRRVYEYRAEAAERGTRAADYVRARHSRSKIAPKMIKRLCEIAQEKEIEIPQPLEVLSAEESAEAEAA